MKPELVIVNGPHRGLTIELDFSKELYIGRSKGADVCLIDDKKVSQLHAKILPVGPERFIIEDLGSTNGSYVNGKQMEQTPLQDGDRLKIGNSLLVFRVDAHEIRQSDVHSWVAESSSSEGPDWSIAGQKLLGTLVTSVNGRAAISETLAHLTPLLSATRGQALIRNPFNGHLHVIGKPPEDSGIPDLQVSNELIREAASKNETVSNSKGAVASPITVCGNVCGAFYFDHHEKSRPSSEGDLEFITLFSQTASLALSRDKQRQIAEIQRDYIELIPHSLESSRADLSKILNSSIELYQNIAEARNIQFDVQIAENLIVGCDDVPLSRAIERLCEYTVLSAESRASISTSVLPAVGTQLLLEYDGRGFDENGLANIFHEGGVAEDFHFALQHGLDGILAFCRGTIELCHGHIKILSMGVDQGASFQVILPSPSEKPSQSQQVTMPRKRSTERYY